MISVGELVLMLERARPDPTRQAFAVVLAHQLEQVGLVMTLPLVELARVQLHRRTPGVGLHAATPPAGAARAIELHDHVADLSRAAAPGPRLAVEDQSAANSRPPEDAEQRVIRPSSAELELRVGGDLHVVADAVDLGASSASRSVAASGNVPSQPGRLRALVTFPSSIVPGRADPDSPELGRVDLGRLGRVAQRALHLRRHILGSAARRRRTTCGSKHLMVVVNDTVWIFVPPRSIPP